MRQIPSFEEVMDRFQNALERFIQTDSYLIEYDVYEKAMTHKLAEYLQQLFPEWNVDCEYNRNGHEPKNVHLDEESSDEEGRTVSTYPDIIVHVRGTNSHNLLVIEMKKSNDRRIDGERKDRKKLIAYARQLNYYIGIYLLIEISANPPHTYQCYPFHGNKWQD